MAMFKGTLGPIKDTKDQYFRSNTKLQAGTHDSPGEKYMIDPRLKRLFRYHFGGDGWVVIPKGRVVAPAASGGKYDDGRFENFDINQLVPALTLANGGVDVTEIGKDGQNYVRAANKPIGLAYGNLYEEFIDGFNGMQPTIENEIYVELPYIPMKADAEEIEWGSAYDKDPLRPLKPGDYIMSDENGRVIKADFDKQEAILRDSAKSADEKFAAMAEISRMQQQCIGQIWTVETPIKDGMAPAGWLKWVEWSMEDQRTDDKMINNSGFRPEDIGAQDGFPGYPYEKSYMNWDARYQKYAPKGIPGLTNGSNIEVTIPDEVLGYVQPGISGRHDFRLLKLPAVDGTVKVFADGVEITPEYVNTELGLVVVNVDNSAGTAPVKVTASYKATGQIPGIPTGWDFKGSIGAIRFLLHK